MSNSTPLPYNLYTIGQAATYLGVSIKTLRRWDAEGRLSSQRNNLNQRLYDPHELQILKNGRKNDAAPVTLMNISTAATQLGVSVKTIRRWEKSGRITSVRNKYNQRLFTPQAIQSAQARLEADRYLPEITKASTNYWQTWPTIRSLLVGTGIVITTLLLFVITKPQIPTVSSPQIFSIQTTEKPESPLSENQLHIASTDDNQLTQVADKNQPLSLTSEEAPPQTATQMVDRPTSTLQPLFSLDTPLATNAADMLIKSIIIEYLNQNPSINVHQDIELAGVVRANLQTLLSTNNPQDRLTHPESSDTDLLPASDIDPYGNLTVSPTPETPSLPLPSPTPSPQPTIMKGTAIVKANQSEISISVPELSPEKLVGVTFQSDYAPATRYWITINADYEGITLHLDQPPIQDAPFTWVIY